LTLAELCDLITDGKHGDCTPDEMSGYYFLSCKDVRDGKLCYEGARQITAADFVETHRRTRLEPGDILITNSGTIGRMAIAPDVELTRRTTFQKSVAIVKVDVKKVDRKWLYYYLLAEMDRLSGVAGGTAQKNLLLRDMRGFQVELPERHTQLRIASILSAYDDQIENNTRRIAILEEMARRIYEEWFVRFRFPGHESVRMVESKIGLAPEGWAALTVGGVLRSLESGSRPKGGIDPNERGVPSIGAENINGLGRYDYGKEKFVSREFFGRMTRGRVRSGDVLLYKDGAHIGKKSLFRDGFPHEECAVNEHVFILRPDSRVAPAYLFFWLDQDEMTQRIRALNANAAQPGINQTGVNGLPLLLPPPHIMSAFAATVEPLLALLFNLAKKNPILSATRNLLLPKLISGELDVTAMLEPEVLAA
jgi:type I restriction enzyme, S subunit